MSKSKHISENRAEDIEQAQPASINAVDENAHEGEYSVKVSVRQLVEFILRSGDIDNRRTSSIENALSEGSRLHRMIQKRMGPNYYSEVLLRHRYQTPSYSIEIEGRADGIIHETLDKDTLLKLQANLPSLNQHLTIEDYDIITIDEIKCVAKSLDYISEPVPVHLAQAKVYAYIYSLQNKLPMIRVRMSYCHMETEEMKYFNFEYSFDEIAEWFEKLMKEYIKWADFKYEWYFRRQSSVKKLEFPFEYREGQRSLAVSVYQSILRNKKLFLEAPTGVGKTISTIFPAVKSMGENLTEKIFYATAKTITGTVAEETFALLRSRGLSLKTVSITAKEKICPLEKAECNPTACERAKGHNDRVNDALYELITQYDKIDRDVITKIAEKYTVCPFELGLDASLFCDAIILDYNYIFDPHASLKRYFADSTGGNYVFLIDEAHNLVERGREMFSALLCKEDILKLKRTLNDALEKQTTEKIYKRPSLAVRMIKALDRCNKEMLAIKKVCDGYVVLEDIDRLAGLVQSLYTVMDEFLDDENDSPLRRNVLDFFFVISHFLMIYEKMDDCYAVYALLDENNDFSIKLLCVNPRNNLSEAMAKGRSSILFSATFLPIQYYKYLLGGDENDYEVYAKSTFDNSKRGLFLGTDVTTKYTRRSRLEYHRIASYIYEITKCKTGNYMVFFPSHAFLANVYERFMDSFHDERYMECMIQEEHMNENMRMKFLEAFENNKGGKNLIGFCVLGGIFSEGIDLKKDSLIGAIVVGTGLPMVCAEREIIKDTFDDDEKAGFDYAYRYPGMNKVLQAAGRVIRTVEDVGIVALLDERFAFNSNKCLFPREWDNIIPVTETNVGKAIENFWSRHFV